MSGGSGLTSLSGSTVVLSAKAKAYVAQRDLTTGWAVANRNLIAHRFLSALGSGGHEILGLAHNTVTPRTIDGEQQWLHCKGAATSDRRALVIPGSRGTYSYLVQPTESQIANQLENAFSLAHGAGRKWIRSEVKGQLSAKFHPDDFFKTDLGGRVVCEDKALIYEEAPQAYKDIDRVIQDMVDADLIRVLALLRPVLNCKTRRR